MVFAAVQIQQHVDLDHLPFHTFANCAAVDVRCFAFWWQPVMCTFLVIILAVVSCTTTGV